LRVVAGTPLGSNPRVLADASFQDWCIEPLCHLSSENTRGRKMTVGGLPFKRGATIGWDGWRCAPPRRGEAAVGALAVRRLTASWVASYKRHRLPQNRNRLPTPPPRANHAPSDARASSVRPDGPTHSCVNSDQDTLLSRGPTA